MSLVLDSGSRRFGLEWRLYKTQNVTGKFEILCAGSRT
jgi:hypothetical protein